MLQVCLICWVKDPQREHSIMMTMHKQLKDSIEGGPKDIPSCTSFHSSDCLKTDDDRQALANMQVFMPTPSEASRHLGGKQQEAGHARSAPAR